MTPSGAAPYGWFAQLVMLWACGYIITGVALLWTRFDQYNCPGCKQQHRRWFIYVPTSTWIGIYIFLLFVWPLAWLQPFEVIHQSMQEAIEREYQMRNVPPPGEVHKKDDNE